MQAKVFWIEGPWPGRLGILARPRGGDWLLDEAIAWHDIGLNVVISLLEPEESAQLQLEEEAAAAAQSGVDFHQFPIADRGVPSSKQVVAQLAIDMVNILDTGRSVTVH